MARKYIFADDITGKEVEGGLFRADMTLSITALTDEGEPMMDEDGKPQVFTAEWEVSGNTSAALQSLVADSDVVSLILRLRPLVSLATADSSVIRAWAKAAHPELTVPDRGRVPAEITALYRREVVAKVNTSDK